MACTVRRSIVLSFFHKYDLLFCIERVQGLNSTFQLLFIEFKSLVSRFKFQQSRFFFFFHWTLFFIDLISSRTLTDFFPALLVFQNVHEVIKKNKLALVPRVHQLYRNIAMCTVSLLIASPLASSCRDLC